jgi:predicted RNase H-like HicB family nuclease
MTELIIHLEDADGEVVWWAESPDVPGFSAAAPSLDELRRRAIDALAELVEHTPLVRERLVGNIDRTDARVATAELVRS